MSELLIDTPGVVAHASFQVWRREHPAGYFLNLRTKTDAMLHRTICQHVGDTEWQCDEDGFNSLTKRGKVCAKSIAELEDWATNRGYSSLKKCPDCDPFPD
jgi:hypothetical protein